MIMATMVMALLVHQIAPACQTTVCRPRPYTLPQAHSAWHVDLGLRPELCVMWRTPFPWLSHISSVFSIYEYIAVYGTCRYLQVPVLLNLTPGYETRVILFVC